MTTELICKEIAEERAGICEFDGLLTREEAEAQGALESEAYRQACEVRTVLDMPMAKRSGYLDRVAYLRGDKAANELRNLVRTEWLRRRTSLAEEKRNAA